MFAGTLLAENYKVEPFATFNEPWKAVNIDVQIRIMPCGQLFVVDSFGSTKSVTFPNRDGSGFSHLGIRHVGFLILGTLARELMLWLLIVLSGHFTQILG